MEINDEYAAWNLQTKQLQYIKWKSFSENVTKTSEYVKLKSLKLCDVF